MENFKWFEKWYSDNVINFNKFSIKVKIENTADFAWKVFIDFDKSLSDTSGHFSESKEKSKYNYYNIVAEKGKFRATGDFTKLDFLLGKFRSFIGYSDFEFSEKDYFMMPDIQNFIFSDSENDNIFLHYTYDKDIAEKIINEGFKFVNFEKTTIRVQNDAVELNYNHIIRKPFGSYVIVIAFSKKIYNKYLRLIRESGNIYLKTEEVLTKEYSSKNENGEEKFLLYPEFVKGYFNYHTGEIKKNPGFNSGFDTDLFLKRIR